MNRLVGYVAVFGAMGLLGSASLAGLLESVGVIDDSSDESGIPNLDDLDLGPEGGERGRTASSRRTLRVTRVIDGDTVDTNKLDRVRLIGVDTPEEGGCYSTAAKRFTRRRLGGRLVGYELGAEKKDRYGRTLAYLYSGATMHDLDLLRQGYAKVLTIPPNDKYSGRFEAAARHARRGNDGLWGICERRVREAKERRIERRKARLQLRARERAERRERERQAAPPSSGAGGGEDNFNIPLIPGD